MQYKKRNRNDDCDDFLLNCNIGCKKHTADRALIVLGGLLALLQERFEQMVALIQSRSLKLHYQNF